MKFKEKKELVTLILRLVVRFFFRYRSYINVNDKTVDDFVEEMMKEGDE